MLIPVRNEEANIPSLFLNLKNLEYENLEIILLDDQSEDSTHKLLLENSRGMEHVKIIQGKNLPEGWIGKNWSCHQLSEHATGDYFLFINADTRLEHKAIHYALNDARKNDLALLSIFPDQIMKSTGEKLVVPLMHYILLSLLPLKLVQSSRKVSLSAANGQFMLFPKKQYNQWHEKVKDKITEDIEIMKKVKSYGLKGKVVLGNSFITCRMYRNLPESIEGFSKNILSGFGNNRLLLFVYTLFIFWGYVFVFQRVIPTILSIFIIGLIRLFISKISNQSIIVNLSLHPLQIIFKILISYKSIYYNITGKNMWKGRKTKLNFKALYF
ncbi:glycosyltransferase [Bacteroidota bacterium]